MSVPDPSSAASAAGGPGGQDVRPSPFTGGGFGLRGLILIVAVAALTMGSAAVAAASFAAFSRVLMATVDSRLLEVANEVARHVDDGLKAGITLGQQQRLVEILDDERNQAPELSSLRVLDERGVVIFSTNRAEIGEAIPTPAQPGDALLVSTHGATGTLRRLSGRTIVIDRPLTGLFGEPIGRVLVALPVSLIADQRQRYGTSLAFAAIGITLAISIVVAVLVYIIPLRQALALQALRGRLDNLFIEAAAGVPGPAPQPTPSLANALDAFEIAARQHLRRLAEHEAALQRLDEDA